MDGPSASAPPPGAHGAGGPFALRVHQRRALAALDDAWAQGRRRAWVVLPPGAGKTRVGLETAARHLAAAPHGRAVVLSPNTAIQGQWVAAAGELGLEADDDRELRAALTSLTYQAVAVFESEDDDLRAAEAAAPDDDRPLLDRLHANGRALVERLRAVPDLLLVLDECHHLLEVWGRLLAELLALLPQARVLGLTATPPTRLDAGQAELVGDLFGEVVFWAGVPALVREGDLAPYLELAHLVVPTAAEEEWLAAEAVRFQELVTRLSDPTFGSLPFVHWLQERFVESVPRVRTWAELTRAEPEEADAALRLHHAGLLALPEGARPAEQHRRDPTPDDWVVLLDDWLRHLARSEHPADREVLDVVRRALPSVGYVWTRRGVRRGRSTVDRVLARSQAKTLAAVELVAGERDTLGEHARVLVLCDHERATATVPSALDGVLDGQEGSARAVLAALVADPATAGLDPLLVTGSTVAGAPATMRALLDRVAAADPGLAGRLEVVEEEGFAVLRGAWTSRRWVPHVTRFFESGGAQVLVGTRGLLGEGWDARRVSTLVDLTTATTSSAVVQTRGRALRSDPAWPGKVALTWSVVCLSESHPRGDQDWGRLVRKHEGFHGVDERGDVVDGVAHLDADFSPYAAPPVAEIEQVNARMRVRARERAAVRAWWRVGAPYVDQVRPTLRVRGALPAGVGPGADTAPLPPAVVAGPGGVLLRGDVPDPSMGALVRRGLPEATATGLALAGLAGAAWQPLVAAGAAAAIAGTAVATLRGRGAALRAWQADLLAPVLAGPSTQQLAAAVADGLKAAGVGPGASGVVVELDAEGEHRCRLDGADEEAAAVFTEALAELLAPLGAPRYVLARFVLTPGDVHRPGRVAVGRGRGAVVAALRRSRPSGMVWHGVPGVLAVNAARARGFAAAWERWVGPTELVYTGSPQGAGILAAQRGSDPFAATTVVRRHWT